MKTNIDIKICLIRGHMRVISLFNQQRAGKKSSVDGFTLVELLVIIVIIGVLVTIAIPTYTYLWNKSKVYRCMDEIRILEKEIIAYQINYGSYPADLSVIHRDKLRDPWGNLYVYSQTPTYLDPSGGFTINDDFDIYSLGKDGALGDTGLNDDKSADDVIRGQNGAYDGLGDKYESY